AKTDETGPSVVRANRVDLVVGLGTMKIIDFSPFDPIHGDVQCASNATRAGGRGDVGQRACGQLVFDPALARVTVTEHLDARLAFRGGDEVPAPERRGALDIGG